MIHPQTVTLALALLAAQADGSPTGSIRLGEPVPDLVLPDAATGEPRSLAELRGERFVLHVFASW